MLSSSFIARIVGAVLIVPPDILEAELPMIAPMPCSWKDLRHRKWVNNVLMQCWNLNEGFQIQAYDEWVVNGADINKISSSPKDSGNTLWFKPSTYGEITSLGARQLFSYMNIAQMKKTHDLKREEVVFMDLGSGTGKLVAQACLEIDGLAKATGIELSPSRHEVALLSRERLKAYHAENSDNFSECFDIDKLHLLEGNLFAADISTATHIYVSSLCFTPQMMIQLETKLLEEGMANRLKTVASLRKLPTLETVPDRKSVV